jgi:integrase
MLERSALGCIAERSARAPRGVRPAEPKIPRRRFHDLRHSAASLLIAGGLELVEVSKLLGHSDIRITGNLYTHLLQQTATKAAKVMDAVLGR